MTNQEISYLEMHVAEMRMLRWMCGRIKSDEIRNEDIRAKVGMASMVDKMEEMMLRWFVHMKRRCSGARMMRCKKFDIVDARRGRGRL